MSIEHEIEAKFGGRLRVRVCGILIEGGRILMANHHSLVHGGDFWSPPGGGMDFGQTAEENLRREFMEETGLRVDVEKFLFVHEYLSPPLHAIELFYKVRKTGGKLITGSDPELDAENQIIRDVRFISFATIKSMGPGNVHQMFNHIDTLEDLNNPAGYFLWKNS